ncbi:hypothetical protein Cgig2_001493 [Carnegiea gigantea]|uniref:RNase H type-1 domain-containing protein n=1 Tax=Carnegiea gigantea TaxID=171969 RepID=A0A9Q1KWF5_9CARY|nr:hypothetical protein Cgig2_001493 [Carnegiea gigantea]
MLERHKSIYFQEARLEPARVQEPFLSSGVFRILKSKEAIPTTPLRMAWKPPMPGTIKLNFDGGCVGEDACGWEFVIRDDNGDILLAGSKQGAGFGGALVEEARASLFGLRCTRDTGVRNILMEGDCLMLIQMLQINRFKIPDILAFALSFDFFSRSFVKREVIELLMILATSNPIAIRAGCGRDMSRKVLSHGHQTTCTSSLIQI